MQPLATKRWYRLSAREWRGLFYMAVVLAVALWKWLPRPWHPTQILDTTRHRIYSTATQPQTTAMAHALELLYTAYSNRLGEVSGCARPHPLLQLTLYRDREEMRRINPGLGWAEAFYQRPYCRAYYAADEANPCHWMLHESVHQLNAEVAHLALAKWLEEGLADYFATCQLRFDRLDLTTIDPNTYPVWWLDSLASTPRLSENFTNGSVIPLRAIVTNHGGPDLDAQVNLYYLHWWTLTRFLLTDPRHQAAMPELIRRGGDLAAFETLIGPVEVIQDEWHAYVRDLKQQLIRQNLEVLKQRHRPHGTPAGLANPVTTHE